MAELIFIGSIFLVFFAYFGYPLTLLVITLIRGRVVCKPSFFPTVTFIVTAYNEEKRIKDKIENTIALEYPRERLQILIASDGSSDATDRIVLEYAERGVQLLPVRERKGKENAQREAVKLARGEVLVFSDVATRLNPDGLAQIVANFADPRIGCVSSVDRVLDRDGRPSGEGIYVRYEMWLRQLESRANSVVGLSGSFFAARREACADFSAEMQSDFRTLLNSITLGMRGVSDPGAIGYYQDVSNPKKEMDRKVRTVVRGLTVFFSHLELLNVFRHGLFSYQLLCHKLMRWLVPVFMVSAFSANFVLAWGAAPYLALFALQIGFYGLALIASSMAVPSGNMILRLPAYFLTVNLAIARAWWRYLRGERVIMWEPSRR